MTNHVSVYSHLSSTSWNFSDLGDLFFDEYLDLSYFETESVFYTCMERDYVVLSQYFFYENIFLKRNTCICNEPLSYHREIVLNFIHFHS